MATELITARALTTVSRVKNRLGIEKADFDTLIERLIMAATDHLESLCNRKFGTATYTNEVYSVHTPALEMLALKNTPVTTLSALQYRAGTPSTPSWTAFTTDDYELVGNGESGLIRIYSGIPRGVNALRATYTAGYKIDFTAPTNTSLHTLPFDLSDLAERMVVKRFKRRESEGKSTETFDGATVTWEGILDAADKEIIARYGRLPTFI